MTQIALNSLACPLDGLPLSFADRSVTCPSGHSFDRAKRGYIHLLPVNQKRSRSPGDSQEMIDARQRFLSAGHYQALATELAEVSAVAPSVSILDAGCGEGYYLRQLAALKPDNEWIGAGLDISKPAIDTAAKHDKGFQYLVASNANIPLINDSVDIVWCVFGFADAEEFHRVLKPGGRLIMVDPGNDHLRELREVIYANVVEKPNSRLEPEGFSLLEIKTLKGHITLDKAGITDLLVMTPHLYRANSAGREAAARLEALTCQYHMHLRIFEAKDMLAKA